MKLVDFLVGHDVSTPVVVDIVDEDGDILSDDMTSYEYFPFLLNEVHGWTVQKDGSMLIYVYRSGV